MKKILLDAMDHISHDLIEDAVMEHIKIAEKLRHQRRMMKKWITLAAMLLICISVSILMILGKHDSPEKIFYRGYDYTDFVTLNSVDELYGILGEEYRNKRITLDGMPVERIILYYGNGMAEAPTTLSITQTLQTKCEKVESIHINMLLNPPIDSSVHSYEKIDFGTSSHLGDSIILEGKSVWLTKNTASFQHDDMQYVIIIRSKNEELLKTCVKQIIE